MFINLLVKLEITVLGKLIVSKVPKVSKVVSINIKFVMNEIGTLVSFEISLCLVLKLYFDKLLKMYKTL